MSLKNLSPSPYTPTEKTAALNHLEAIEATLSDKFKTLSSADRLKFGSVHEQNKLLINKVRDLRDSQPVLCCPDIDWNKFLEDIESREFLQNYIMRLENLLINLKNNKILHDYDNYQAALTDYDYAKFKKNSNNFGYESKVIELAQFFNRTGTTVSRKPTEDSE
ncbi:hypothetical protein GON26_18305 [Flavobacterium sp. GA093]|uniref:Uncharacterized protein n=1 Tax=Flavobacterium hydrocarbonoxydans TaxID=2683249 RepID=A0A6I4NX56_9FLAO|nr:hypothetical protein [Flavobacterium hydrocarbonoxydans]MWB96319.1 hypothetical protein [Flavobacterium hydrocarbonoxydans]